MLGRLHARSIGVLGLAIAVTIELGAGEARAQVEVPVFIEDESDDTRPAMPHFSPGLLPRARRIASFRARRNPSKSSPRPTRSSTWTASPALEKKRTPTSHVTSRASANLMSMVPPAQPTTPETTRVGCTLEVENGTSEETWDRICDRTEELFDRQSPRQPAAACLVLNAGEECACGRHAEPLPNGILLVLFLTTRMAARPSK